MSDENTTGDDAAASDVRDRYTIPDSRFSGFESAIAKLAKRATKLGLTPIGFVETGTSYREIDGQDGLPKSKILMHEVEVFGQRPYIKGWRFCGKLEHLPHGAEVIVKELRPGDVPVNYRSCEPNCEHCKTARYRKDTFIILNTETGEYMQIGRSCLNDFFGGKDPEAVAALFEFMRDGFDELREMEDMDSISMSGPQHFYTPEDVLVLAAAAIREDGMYISVEKGESIGQLPTSYLVRANLTQRRSNLSSRETLHVTDDDRSRAAEVLTWLKSEEVAKLDQTYFHNLRVMAEANAVSLRNIGMFASAVAAYDRARDHRQAQDAAATSRHVGTEGEKLDLKVTLLGTRVIPGSRFGDTVLHRFLDDDGNLLVWFCSGFGAPFVDRESYHIRGTVKQHGEYGGAKQTTLERVSCSDFKVFDWIADGDITAPAFAKKLRAVHDVNIRESGCGRTPILKAIVFGREDLARELLKAGARLDVADDAGNTVETIRPEAYAALRSEALAEGWMTPEPGVQYGFIECDESSVGTLRGYGVRSGPYDVDHHGVLAEVPPAAQAWLAQFPADFKPDLMALDPHDDDTVRRFVDCQLALAPTHELRTAWQAKTVDFPTPEAKHLAQRNRLDVSTLSYE